MKTGLSNICRWISDAARDISSRSWQSSNRCASSISDNTWPRYRPSQPPIFKKNPCRSRSATHSPNLKRRVLKNWKKMMSGRSRKLTKHEFKNRSSLTLEVFELCCNLMHARDRKVEGIAKNRENYRGTKQ